MSDPRYSVAGSGHVLDKKQQDLIALAESLGPAFAKRAEKYDREASFPFENYADLKSAGLLGLCVPKRFGGMGADLRTYALVSATLGKYCGATALIFNMHACSTLWPGRLADDLDMTAEMENANALCALAIRTCGGQSMLKSLPLERLYRDSRCGALMLPWTAELCLDRIGREALYEPGESDD